MTNDYSVKENVIYSLKEHLKEILDSLKNNSSIEIVIKDEDKFISIIEAYPRETLIETLVDIVKILERLDNALINTLIKRPDYQELRELKQLLQEEGKSEEEINKEITRRLIKDKTRVTSPQVINIEINFLDFLQYKFKLLHQQFSDDIVAACYQILYRIAAHRLLLYFDRFARAVFYLFCNNILQQDHLSEHALKEALSFLTNITKNKAKIRDKTIKEDVTLFLLKAVNEAFWDNNKNVPLNLKEGFIKAVFGDYEMRFVPYKVALDLWGAQEASLAKKTGVPIQTLRNHKKKIKELIELVNEGKEPPEKLEQAFKEYAELFKKEISIVHTDQKDFDGVPTDKMVSNEEKVEYFIKNPEENALFVETREKLCGALQDWADMQPGQAHLAREVVEYVVRAIKDPDPDVDEVFKVTKIAKALNVDKKNIRRVFNKMKEGIPLLKDFYTS